MAIAKYAHVLTTSTSNNLGNTDSNIFDENNYSSFTKKAESNGITYSSSTGEFTVDEDGTYFVFVTVQASLTSPISFDSIRCRVKLNGTEVEAGIFDFRDIHGVVESSFQTLVTATSGQKITITLHDPHSISHGLKAEKFSSVFIFKTENGFGRVARTTASNFSSLEFNAFATSSGGATTTNFSSDAKFSETDAGSGLFKFNNDVNALFFINNYLEGNGGSPAVDIDFKLDGTIINTYKTAKPAPAEPVEASILSAYSFSTNTSASILYDAVGVSYNTSCNISSSMTAVELPSEAHFLWRTVKTDSDIIPAGTEFNVFATGTYTKGGYNIFGTGSGITFASGSGLVTLAKDADYAVFSNFYGAVAGDTDFMYKIQHNSSVADNILFHMDSGGDPGDRTVVTVITGAVAGDTIRFFASGSSQNMRANTGAGFIVLELFAPDPPPPTPTVPPDPLIANDFTLNTYSIETLTAQYDTTGVEQVPFMLGGLGPLRLRGRTVAPVVKKGDKKN